MKQVPLSEVAEFINGRAFKPEDWQTEGLPIIRIQNLTGSTDTVNYYSGEVEPRYLVRNDDILISWSASLGVYKWQGGDAILNQHIFKVELKEKLIDKEYFYYAAQNALVEMQSHVHGATMQHITRDPFLAIEIPLPPLTEQKRIASLLARADRLRQLRQTAHDLGDALLQSVFLEMFGDIAVNPKGWDIATLEDLETDFIYGTSQKCFSEPKGLPVLRIPNILHGSIDLEDLKYAEVPEKEAKNILLKHGDIIFVRTNGNPDYVGRCAVFNLDKDLLFASYLIRARVDLSKINPVFLLNFLQTAKGREAMAPYIRTTAGQSNIGIEGLGQIPVPVPPLSLQEEFAGVVARVESLRGRMG
ncbi:MAG: restriction endonuclease subunit S, partial [Anaerolineales bacterium]|nr:restriction endonuclease subunit S [Anaerolineales bacterium]